ncbi:MAG: nucleosidase [Mediterranea sp.]|jgi:adenosylhomocysteine nucleosidase|nr:nucleosidase [Mediterranea sp.]
MRILVTYAVQEEFTELKFPGLHNGKEVEIGYLRTGIGKVKSAYYLTEVLNAGKPDLVINMGTAGTIHRQVGDVVVCRHFIDRDMLQAAALGLEYEIDTAALLEEKGYCKHWGETGTCNTGDSFLTELGNVAGDVVDMEAYAQAFVCRAKDVPFISVKYVTDVLGQNSVKHWEDKLADAREGLSHFFNEQVLSF